MFKFGDKYILLPNPCFFTIHMVSHVKNYKLKIKITMFWVNRSKTPIQQEIEEFGAARKKYSTINSQLKHLYEFVKITGIRSFDDVTQIDIDAYNESVRQTINSEYLQSVAIQAVQLFMKYRNINKKRMAVKKRGRPEKLKRNEDIMALREMRDGSGNHKYSYSMIGKKYKISKVTVFTIVKRLENKG